MVRFYDPKNSGDLARVEEILKKGAIEYFVSYGQPGVPSPQVRIAEEDLFKAEELLQKAERRQPDRSIIPPGEPLH